MRPMYYNGLDVHTRKISCCVKDSSCKIHIEGFHSLLGCNMNVVIALLG